MTGDGLRHLIGAYGTGLEAELALLRRLRALSTRQPDASTTTGLETLNQIGDERERLMNSLLALEHDLKPTRELLWEHRLQAAALEEFHEVAARHRSASDLVTTILSSDRDTLQVLRETEEARRAAAQAIEVGETTLAAYRRVITPTPDSPAIMNRRG